MDLQFCCIEFFRAIGQKIIVASFTGNEKTPALFIAGSYDKPITTCPYCGSNVNMSFDSGKQGKTPKESIENYGIVVVDENGNLKSEK